jgi:hypothetical protein
MKLRIRGSLASTFLLAFGVIEITGSSATAVTAAVSARSMTAWLAGPPALGDVLDHAKYPTLSVSYFEEIVRLNPFLQNQSYVKQISAVNGYRGNLRDSGVLAHGQPLPYTSGECWREDKTLHGHMYLHYQGHVPPQGRGRPTAQPYRAKRLRTRQLLAWQRHLLV